MPTMSAEQYLSERGWISRLYYNKDGAIPEYCDGRDGPIVTRECALTIQRARDAAEERRCVSDAIANAAARHSKSANGVTDEQKRAGVTLAAELALAEFRFRFAVTVEPDAEGA